MVYEKCPAGYNGKALGPDKILPDKDWFLGVFNYVLNFCQEIEDCERFLDSERRPGSRAGHRTRCVLNALSKIYEPLIRDKLIKKVEGKEKKINMVFAR